MNSIGVSTNSRLGQLEYPIFLIGSYLCIDRYNFSGGTGIKNPPANAGDSRDMGLIPGSGKSLGVGNGNPFQYSCLASSMDGEPDGLQSMGSRRVAHD